MKKLIESITGGYTSSARVVDGSLILSLPDALSPVVWRMDLGEVKSSALEVRETPEGSFVLALKTPRADVHNIAPFASRALALKALMAVSEALEHSGGQLHPANDDAAAARPVYRKKAGPGKWLAGAGAVVALVLMAGILMKMGPASQSLTGQQAYAPPNLGGPAPDDAGVPLSADDFLRMRQ